MTNDPCDEWPKPVIYRIAGFETCGCRVGRCVCERDYPLHRAACSTLVYAGEHFDTGRQVERDRGAP